ncbi:MAG TPA: hypothetical protein VGN42_15320, partial [Pirellulales bacterium]|nr:hypothetical protein [Pirellulales bacterium]
LVEACLGRLGPLGILKCNIYLYVDNAAGAAFWRHLGWQDRAELKVMQRAVSGDHRPQSLRSAGTSR